MPITGHQADGAADRKDDNEGNRYESVDALWNALAFGNLAKIEILVVANDHG